ncbi:MAG: hypothetical protein ACPL06_03270 [Candidatus Anstonellales archaeon]
MPRKNGGKVKAGKVITKRRPVIRVDEHTMILKIINDASKELDRQNNKNFLEMAYSLRDTINKANGASFSDREKSEVKELLRRAKITMLLRDKEQEFKALSQIEKDILKAFRG